MSSTWIIFRKELREVVRDRKTLIFMLVLPTLVLPLLLHLVTDFAMKTASKASAETLRYTIVGAERLPELEPAFAQAWGFARVDIEGTSAADIKSAISREQIAFAVVVEPRGAAPVDDAVGPQLTAALYYDNASTSSKAKERAAAVLTRLGEELRLARLDRLGVAGEAQRRLLEPVVIDERGTAELRAVVGARVGGMLPYLFIAFCFLGALYPAIDIGAGEKERGTLETLLLVPVMRWRIVLGKYLVVFTAATTAALLSLLSLGVWIVLKGRAVAGELGDRMIAGIIESIGPLDLALIAAMLVPTAAMLAAVLLSISIYAKSFKEAQSFAMPFQFLAIIPAFIAMLPGVELDWGWAMVPITNMALATKELIKGTMDYTMLIAILGSSVTLAGALLGFCTWWFHREAVLFRH